MNCRRAARTKIDGNNIRYRERLFSSIKSEKIRRHLDFLTFGGSRGFRYKKRMGNAPSATKEKAQCFGGNLTRALQSSLQHLLIEPETSLEESPPKPQPPKHMLWGCNTVEEHYAYINKVCEMKINEEDDKEGALRVLRDLGFEFRMVHHPERCMCDFIEDEHNYDDGCDDQNVDDGYFENGNATYLVPIGTPLQSFDPNGGEQEPEDQSKYIDIEPTFDRWSRSPEITDSSRGITPRSGTSSVVSRSISSVSLFSLGTHYSRTDSNSTKETEEGCALRLFHFRSETLVTPENHETFIAHGKMYDKVAELCMEYAKSIMMEQGNLVPVSVSDSNDTYALVSRNRVEASSGGRPTAKRRVLLIVTGKGLVRAGIFSRRHLMTMGAEPATAIPLIREAVRRDMDIVMLDPNAKGHRMGMDVVERSLERVFSERNEQEEEIYVVAHSMAGAQLVRLLHKKAMPAPVSSAEDNANETANHGGDMLDTNSSDSLFQRKIKAIAFTDSNHNINWVKNNPELTNLLVGSSSLYIKAHKLHDDAKPLGEPHHKCDFWKHRFGSVRTIWAGTHEHALTNYTARHHIWQHFDSFIEQQTDHNNDSLSEEDDDSEEPIPTF